MGFRYGRVSYEGFEYIETFSHLILLYALHAAGEPLLTVRPFLDDTPRGSSPRAIPAVPTASGFPW